MSKPSIQHQKSVRIWSCSEHNKVYYLSVARGNMTRLNSQVMIGGGCALILQDNLAMEPCVTTTDTGWIVKEEMPAGDQNTGVSSHGFVSVCCFVK